MSVKSVTVITPGGNVSVQVPVDSKTTANDVITAAGLDGNYQLSTPDGDLVILGPDRLDPIVNDGGILHASLKADLGVDLSIVLLGIRDAALAGLLMALAWIIWNLIKKEKDAKKQRESVGIPPHLVVSRPTGRSQFWLPPGWKRTGNQYSETASKASN